MAAVSALTARFRAQVEIPTSLNAGFEQVPISLAAYKLARKDPAILVDCTIMQV